MASLPALMETPQFPVISLGASSRQLYTSIAVSKESFSAPLLSPFVCAIAAVTGYPWCWGHFPLTNYTLWAPSRVSGERMFTSISSGGTFACGLDNAGIIACWSGVFSEPVVISANIFSGIALGVNSTCGLTGTTVWCWGSNLMLDDMIPNPKAIVAAGSQGFISISAGPSMTCGVATTADIWCWSIAYDGTAIGVTRKAIGPFSLVSVGKDAACALDFYGHASCWGVNLYNWLGIEDTSAIVTTASPVRGVPAFQSISVGSASGEAHVCGILLRGGLVCWGATAFGRTGTGYSAGTLTLPTAVITSSMEPVSSSIAYSISSGASFTCALYSDQSLLVTGQNNEQWACINQGWQYIWDGSMCIRAPNCYELGTDVSWDGNSCASNFAPAFCNSNDFNYDPLHLSCGAPGSIVSSGSISNWANSLPSINSTASSAETAASLPGRDTLFGSALMVNETGAVTVFLTTSLLGVSANAFDDADARTVFSNAVLTSLSGTGVKSNSSTVSVVITGARDIMTQAENGIDARLRRLGASVTSAKTPALGRRVALVDVSALVIDFYLSSFDANFILQAATLAVFASTNSSNPAMINGIAPASASYLGAAFLSTLAGALQASTSPVFATASILSLATMPLAAPTLTPSPTSLPSATSSPTSTATTTSINSTIGGAAAGNVNNVEKPFSDGQIVGITIGALVAAAIVVAAILKKTRTSRGESVGGNSANASASDTTTTIGVNPSLSIHTTTTAGESAVGNLAQYRSPAASSLIVNGDKSGGGHAVVIDNETIYLESTAPPSPLASVPPASEIIAEL
jgi:hypothetical protein